jgi:hypothetical protein
MRNLVRGGLAIAFAGLWLASASCDWVTIRDCVLYDTLQDGSSQVSYTAVIPSNCPVPIGAIGEQKFMGATITDAGDVNYLVATVIIKNSNDNQVGSDIDLFVATSNTHRAFPKASYAAATGYSGSISNGVELPSAARDRGFFSAIKTNGQTGMMGTLRVNYIGTNVAASISGPDLPLNGEYGSWSASASGGTTPYSYAWYRNGELVSTSSSYADYVGSSEFGLRVVVTDNATSSRWTDYWVDVDGVRVTISGPSIIYYSEGNATWTSSIRGGYASYSVDWYLEDMNGNRTYQGSGSSLTTYPSYAGQYFLYAVATDSHGTANTSPPLMFTAIGDGQGGCVPTPPQIICDP